MTVALADIGAIANIFTALFLGGIFVVMLKA
jgi:hypothetical protein